MRPLRAGGSRAARDSGTRGYAAVVSFAQEVSHGFHTVGVEVVRVRTGADKTFVAYYAFFDQTGVVGTALAVVEVVSGGRCVV